MSTHLPNLAAKIDARRAKQSAHKPGDGPLTGRTYDVTAKPVRSTRAMRQADHRKKMAERAVNRAALPARVSIPASINRRTGKPHEHRREIARRARQTA